MAAPELLRLPFTCPLQLGPGASAEGGPEQDRPILSLISSHVTSQNPLHPPLGKLPHLTCDNPFLEVFGVKPSADELRRHYESLSDEELQEIDPAELTAVARECYDQEMARRGTPEEIVVEGEDADAPEYDAAGAEIEPDWVDHAACACSYTAYPGTNHAEDAARAQDALAAAGIPCYLSLVQADAENSGSEGARYDEYRVLVPEPLNLKAISVLDQQIFNPLMEADWRAHFAQLSDDDLAQL